MTDLPGRVHVVGAGGAGMSGLAKLLSQMGHEVTGSDLKFSAQLHGLEQLGVEVWEGSHPAKAAAADLVVTSSAVPESDPEVQAASKAGVDVWQRPQMLSALTEDMPAIGPTGTHGKTTSAAMMISALRHMGLDPTFVIGGEMTDLRTGAHLGSRQVFVLEVDEAFGTFEHLHLAGLMVTSVEAEHLDHFGTIDRLEDAFVRVARNVEGPVVACLDDPGAARLAERTGAVTYGFDASADWRIGPVLEEPLRVAFSVAGGGGTVKVGVEKPGLHNARNATGVLALLAEIGLDPEAVAAGLHSFRGVKRRFELRGVVAGVTMIDDYAHHPTEVAATIRAARRGRWRQIWAVFQPHLYSRTAAMHNEFGAAFSGVDHVVITDVYGAREAPIPGVTGSLVASAAGARTGATVAYIPHRSDVADHLAERVESGDLVLTLGAGDITQVPDELAARLAGAVR